MCPLFGQEHIWVVQGAYCNTYCCVPCVTSPWLAWLWLWWTVPTHAANFLSQSSQRFSIVLFSLKLQEFAYSIQRFNGINFLDRVSQCGWELVEKYFSLCLKKDNSNILFYMLWERIPNKIEPQDAHFKQGQKRQPLEWFSTSLTTTGQGSHHHTFHWLGFQHSSGTQSTVRTGYDGPSRKRLYSIRFRFWHLIKTIKFSILI